MKSSGVCGSHTCSILCSAPGINVTEFLSRMCLFTVFLCHLVALFFLTMCSCKTESYLPLKTIISPDKCQQRILSHMHRDLLLLFLAVSMQLAISYPLTIPRGLCQKSCMWNNYRLSFSESKLFLRLSAFKSVWLAWLHVLYEVFKHIAKSRTLQISPVFKLLNYFCLFGHSTTRWSAIQVLFV